MYNTDTICAISTAVSSAGINIIRISGDLAVEAADKILVKKSGKHFLSEVDSHTINHGFIVDKNDGIIDEVMVSVMRSPKSYTTEDVVEINCHGGISVTKSILEEIINTGLVRLAEPGEFSKRAFLNGRIDLSSAEAIMNLISAKSKLAARNSIKQMEGGLKEKIDEIKDILLNDDARIEAYLDDPENLDLDGFDVQLNDDIRNMKEKLNKLIDSYQDGKIIDEGINTVILGRPNAGKSSIMNILSRSERSIVTDIAGTTRDTIEETIRLGDIVLNIIDTAGIHETEDVIEKIGIKKAESKAKEADFCIVVIDSSVGIGEDDKKIFNLIKDKKSVVLLNKSDLNSNAYEALLEEIRKDTNSKVILTSAKKGEGFDELKKYIEEEFLSGRLKNNDDIYITNERQLSNLKEALNYISNIEKSIEMGMSEDFYTIDIMGAYHSLSEITGEDISEDLINRIFEKFCMGK